MGVRELGKRTAVGSAAVLAALLVLLVGAIPAAAQETDMYASFGDCPTSGPEMNNPANEGAACLSALVKKGSIRLGNLGSPITSPMHFQAALVGGGEAGLVLVPGSTSVHAAPITFPNPFYVPPSDTSPGNPTVPVPSKPHRKKHNKKHRKHVKQKHKKRGKKNHKGHGRHASGSSRDHGRARSSSASLGAASVPVTQAAAGSGALIEAFVENLGDVRNLNISAFAGEPGTAFEVSLRVHLVGAGLGSSCFIGSEGEPIVLAPEVKAPPTTFAVSQDPNGFPTKVIGVGGEVLEDAAFAVPPAKGCGTVSPLTGDGTLDQAINAVAGLPAPVGESKAVLANVLMELVGAEYDGTPPDGGAEIQAAFDAAQ